MPHKQKKVSKKVYVQLRTLDPHPSKVQFKVLHQYLSRLPKDPWELSQMLGRGGRDGKQAAFVILLWAGQAGWQLTSYDVLYDPICPGGRGASKALGRVLLEQRVERQKCQREAMNALFQVDNPFSE